MQVIRFPLIGKTHGSQVGDDTKDMRQERCPNDIAGTLSYSILTRAYISRNSARAFAAARSPTDDALMLSRAYRRVLSPRRA